MSSGVFVRSWDTDVHCRKCLFEGVHEVFTDPEDQAYWWTCPICEYEWDCEGVPRFEGEG